MELSALTGAPTQTQHCSTNIYHYLQIAIVSLSTTPCDRSLQNVCWGNYCVWTHSPNSEASFLCVWSSPWRAEWGNASAVISTISGRTERMAADSTGCLCVTVKGGLSHVGVFPNNKSHTKFYLHSSTQTNTPIVRPSVEYPLKRTVWNDWPEPGKWCGLQ